MSELKRIAKNSVFNFLGNASGKVITVFLIAVLARALGAEGYGKLSFVIGFTGLFSVIGGFGFHIFLRRLIARDKEKVNYYVSNVIAIKVFLNILAFALIILSAHILDYDPGTISLIYLGAVFLILQNLTPFTAVYEAFEKNELVFFTRIGKAVLRFSAVVYFMTYSNDVRTVLLIYATMEALVIIADFIIYNIAIKRIRFEFDSSVWLKYLKQALPFGIGAIFMMIDDKIDITMLSKLVPNPDLSIGFYSPAYDFIGAVAFIPSAISGALAPIAYRAFVNNISKLKRLYVDSFKLFFAMAVPIAIGGTLIADKIVYLIYGSEFTGSVIALQILSWNTLFYFEMFAFGLALNSMNMENKTMLAIIIAVIFNVIANAILIPIFDYVGAAMVTVGSSIVYFIFCFTIVQKELVKIDLFRTLPPIIFSGMVMGIVIYLIKHLNLFLIIPIAAAIYLGTLFLTKSVRQEDIKMIWDALR